MDPRLQLLQLLVRGLQSEILHDHGLREKIGSGRLRLDLVVDKGLRLLVARRGGICLDSLEHAGEELAFFG